MLKSQNIQPSTDGGDISNILLCRQNDREFEGLDLTDLVHHLLYIKDHPKSYSCIVCKSITKARTIFARLVDEFKDEDVIVYTDRLHIIFKSGATVSVCHMTEPKDRYDHSGMQYTYVAFIESNLFEVRCKEYLISRLRSQSYYNSSIYFLSRGEGIAMI